MGSANGGKITYPEAAMLGLTIAICLAACGDVTCDEDSPEVAFALQLPDERWERLVTDVRQLRAVDPDGWWSQTGNTPGIPPVLIDLKPVDAKFRNDELFIKLKGCFDHHVMLTVDLGETGEESVSLQWGEGPTAGRQVLWRASFR